jgi:hypothetical protein
MPFNAPWCAENGRVENTPHSHSTQFLFHPFPQTLASIAVDDIDNDLKYLLEHEFSSVGVRARGLLREAAMSGSELAAVVKSAVRPIGRTCSMFGVWGSRTADGQLFTGRNLDWVRLFKLCLCMWTWRLSLFTFDVTQFTPRSSLLSNRMRILVYPSTKC